LAAASGATSPSRASRRNRCKGDPRFCRGTPETGIAGKELRGLADFKFWQDVRRVFSNAVHAEVSHYNRRQHEHRLARSAHLPSEPRGGIARSHFAFRSSRPLHHSLSLPERRWICKLSEEVCSPRESATQPRTGID